MEGEGQCCSVPAHEDFSFDSQPLAAQSIPKSRVQFQRSALQEHPVDRPQYSRTVFSQDLPIYGIGFIGGFGPRESARMR